MNHSQIIIPSSGTIDMYEDVPCPITYSIANIREPDKRNSTYSKTIKIPGTHNNNTMFGNIFNTNTALLTFDPNKKAYCYLMVDNVAVMTGYLQLSNITILDNSDIEYDVFLLGQSGNPFYAMGNAELTDLDFSEFTHTYNYSTQVASWTNQWDNGYCYPLIDYGFDSDTDEVDVEHLQPAIFVKQYVKKILESVGYTYTSTFIDGDFFEHLVIPANAQNITYSTTEINEFLFEYNQTAVSSGSLNGGTSSLSFNFDIKYNDIVSDPNLLYDTSTGEWTVQAAGHHNLTASTTFVLTDNFGASFTLIGLLFMKKPPSGIYSNIGLGTQNPAASLTIEASMSNIFLNEGDKIKIMGTVAIGPPLNGFTTDPSKHFEATTNGGNIKNAFVNSGLIEGDTLNLNNAVPVKIKQKDLFLSIVKMFNLYVDIDVNNPNNLIIETRDDYYSSGDIVDWSLKLDYNKPVESEPMGALDFKELLWNYTDDSDYYNKKYKDKYKETYGLKRYVTNNEFQSQTNETKVIFSPTPLVNDLSNDRIIPVIWDVDTSNNVSHKSFNIRILYNGGVKSTANPYDYTGRYSGSHINTQYLYAGHLDDPSNPTLDLSFGVPREIFYNTTVYTNNNLFNRFFANQLSQITNINSRIVTANFKLTPGDINNLSFRDKFFFENDLFVLNEIKDYDPLNDETVQCSFLKLTPPTPVATGQTDLNGGYVAEWEGGYPVIR